MLFEYPSKGDERLEKQRQGVETFWLRLIEYPYYCVGLVIKEKESVDVQYSPFLLV